MISKRIYITIWAISLFACSNVGSTNNMKKRFDSESIKEQQKTSLKEKVKNLFSRSKNAKNAKDESISEQNQPKKKKQKTATIQEMLIHALNEINKNAEKNNKKTNEMIDKLLNLFQKRNRQLMSQVIIQAFKHETGIKYLMSKQDQIPFNLDDEILKELDHFEKLEDSRLNFCIVDPTEGKELIQALWERYTAKLDTESH